MLEVAGVGTEDDPLWGQRTVLQGTWDGLERGRGWPGMGIEDCPIGDDQAPSNPGVRDPGTQWTVVKGLW